MNWITKFIKPKIASLFKKKTSESDQILWTTCECKNLIYKEDLQKNLNCCPKCGAHHKLTCIERFETFFDDKELQSMLIAAYLPGIGISKNEFETIFGPIINSIFENV